MPTPAPSNATDSSATWPKPRAGWRPPASDSPTSRSSSARRPPWSRPRGRARPSWPTRSTSSGTASNADPTARGQSADARDLERGDDRQVVRRIARLPVDGARGRSQAARQQVVDAVRAARRAPRIAGRHAVARERIVEAARQRPHLGRLDRRVEVAGHDDRRPQAVGDRRQHLGLGTSLVGAGIGQVGLTMATSARARPDGHRRRSEARGSRTARPRT